MPFKAEVAIIIGSESDRDAVKPLLDALTELKIPWSLSVFSCHRHFDELRQYLQQLPKSVGVIIAAAGMAAALPGFIAAELRESSVIVIGVALKSSDSDGMDALLAMTRLPSGVPLVCAGLGPGAAVNAALVAAKVLVSSSLESYFEDLRVEKPPKPDLQTWFDDSPPPSEDEEGGE